MVVVHAHQIPAAPRLGNVISAVAISFFLIGLCIEMAFRLSSGRGVLTWAFIQTSSLTLALCISGRILLGPVSARPVGRVLLASGCAGALSFFCTALGNVALLWGSVLAVPLHLTAQTVWPLYVIPMLTLLPLIFPTGSLLNRHWRVVVWGSVAGMAVLMVATMTAEELLIDQAGGNVLANPFFSPRWFRFFVTAGSVLALGAVLASVSALVLRWVQGTRLIRQQISLIAVSLLIFLLFQVFRPVLDFDVFQFGMTVSPMLIIVSIAVAVLRYELYDIHLVLKRFVVYTSLTILLTALFLTVYLCVLVFVTQLPINSSPWSAVVVGGVVVGLCAEPGRRRLQGLLERRVFGERGRPLVAMSRLRDSTLEIDDQSVLNAIAATIARAVKSPGAALELHHDGHLNRKATVGVSTSNPFAIPLLYRQETLGQLLIGRRTPTEEYGPRDRELLKQLGDQAATIVYGLRRDAELAAARQEAVASAAEVRAQLGRDLHDGFVPLLAGAGLTAEALRRGFEPGSPDEASAARLAETLRTAAGEARRFAHDLQPTALTDVGLIVAVHDWIDSLHGVDLPAITLDADDCELPEAIEQAGFLFVLEAVTNVLRHAGASRATVVIRRHPGSVVLSVEDNGTGLAAPYVSGVGLTSMRQRVHALDGIFDIRSVSLSGTIVIADIPVST